MQLKQIHKNEINFDLPYLCKVLGSWSAGYFLKRPFDIVVFSGYSNGAPIEWITEFYEISE